MVRLDDAFQERVDVMKIDVEGYESCVIAGGKELLRRHGVPVLYLELWPSLSPCAPNTTALVQELLDLKYVC